MSKLTFPHGNRDHPKFNASKETGVGAFAHKSASSDSGSIQEHWVEWSHMTKDRIFVQLAIENTRVTKHNSGL